jgi:hypothetical protein
MLVAMKEDIKKRFVGIRQKAERHGTVEVPSATDVADAVVLFDNYAE